MQLPILLDRLGTRTLTAQIVEQLRDAIRSRRIASGTRLPSSRRLSEQLQVSRNTAVRAYELLEDEGFVESRAASGIFAVFTGAAGPSQPDLIRQPAPEPAVPMRPPLALRLPQLPLPPAGMRMAIDFEPGRPNPALFPLKTWRRLVHTALSHGGLVRLSQYPDPGGLPELRAAIASWLSASRGLLADPAQVVVVAGLHEGVSLAARLFLSPGQTVVMENPGHTGAARAFDATGARIETVPVDGEGLMAEALPDNGAALLYVTPEHQFPLGSTMSPARRAQMVAWARRHGCYIIEGDCGSDLRFEGSRTPAVAAMAPDACIHIGSFSATLGPGLRLGYMVVPAALVDAVRALKSVHTRGHAWLEQAALADFLRSGSFHSHMQRLRGRYRETRDALVSSLHRHFGEVEISGEAAGLHLLWQLPPGVPDAATVEALARKGRIGVYPLAAAGVRDVPAGNLTKRGLLLGHGGLTPKQINQGIARLSDVIDDALDSKPDSVGQLLVQPPERLARRPVAALRLRRAPALRAAPPLPPPAPDPVSFSGPGETPVVRGIYRYPVKGLSAQSLPGVELEAGKPFPFDRVMALARPGVPIDHSDPKWAKKGLFVMLMLDDALAQVRTAVDPETMVITVRNGAEIALSARLDTREGRAAVETFFQRLLPGLEGVPRLVRSRDGHFMDKPDNVLSVVNLATVRALERQWNVTIDPLRFRANLYIDGVPPWQEFDWVGCDIRIGDVVFRVDRRNGRCRAASVNPSTGARDLDVPGALRTAFGHKDLGVYVITRKGGKVVVGDPVAVPNGAAAMAEFGADITSPPPGERRFICRGCFHVFDERSGLEAHGIPPATPFSNLPSDWRCPDCGTQKASFRPHFRVPA
jgi:GntR family transcriptional regulator/MocR family aminotransferase